MRVDAGNENILHLVMDTPSMDVVGEFMASKDFTKARQGAGVLVETTQITVLKQSRNLFHLQLIA